MLLPTGAALALLLLTACAVQEPSPSSASDDAGPAAPAHAAAQPVPAGASITPEQLLGSFHADSNRNRTFEILRNGRYVLKGGVVWERVESTWSLEENGTRLRLHHDHRANEDLLFAVESPDVLVLINNDGSAPALRSTLLRVRA